MQPTGIIYNIQRMSVQDGPGMRTTVFFKGCPLRCIWCSNPESQRPEPQLMAFREMCTGCGACTKVCPRHAVVPDGRRFLVDRALCGGCGKCVGVCPSRAREMSGRECSMDQVMNVIRKDASLYRQSHGGVTFGGGECTMQGDFLLALMDACIAEGYHVCVDTCGHTKPEVFDRLVSQADLFLFDIKHMDSERHRQLTGVGNELIQRNLRAVLQLDPEKVCIRIPLMPGLNDSEENIGAVADLLLPYGKREVEVMPCHSFGWNKYLALQRNTPDVREYAPGELMEVKARFAAHGLEAVNA